MFSLNCLMLAPELSMSSCFWLEKTAIPCINLSFAGLNFDKAKKSKASFITLTCATCGRRLVAHEIVNGNWSAPDMPPLELELKASSFKGKLPAHSQAIDTVAYSPITE